MLVQVFQLFEKILLLVNLLRFVHLFPQMKLHVFLQKQMVFLVVHFLLEQLQNHH